MNDDIIFQPLSFRHLAIKNRLIRSSISGRWDNYDGSGTQARVNWETRFARGGVGAIISSFVPVHVRGRILPNYAMIDRDDRIPFWRRVGQAVHAFDCRYILQLSHGGRQRDVGGVENLFNRGLSSTNHRDTFHGLLSQAMTLEEIHATIEQFARGAARAREAGLDGVELHASHGYLFTQFLSSAINDRTDQYGGSLQNRARFLLDVVRAIRRTVGTDFHLQVKINALDVNNALFPWERRGNTLAESIEICRWLEQAGVDALHVSMGSTFPHPLIPPGGLPADELKWWYGGMGSSGVTSFFNYVLFRYAPLRPLFMILWNRAKKKRPIEAICAPEALAVRKQVGIPVMCTGGFQRASVIRDVLRQGLDAVTIARPLIANNDLPEILRDGKDQPDRPCSFCNRCLVNAIANPLGCYDERRFADREEMIRTVMSVFDPPDAAVARAAGSGPGGGDRS